jgi:hypothetical protein
MRRLNTAPFEPEDFNEGTIEAFDRGWSSVSAGVPGARRRAGLAAALNHMYKLAGEDPNDEVRSDPE